MEEYRELNENENHEVQMTSAPAGVNRWLGIAVLLLLGTVGVALGYGYRQRLLVGHLTAQEAVANATISQMQGQLNTMSAKLNEMATAQQSQNTNQATTNQAPKKAAVTGHAAPRRAPVVDKRYKQLQAELDVQRKQLKDTQDLVAKNRADLEGNISSTRDELNGSIARTHEELVVLQKRGERNYFEFDLSKSKQFQRVGPLTLSLRKADTKHKSYDLQMIVDDNHLDKKKVNLYEPIWIHTENESQPVQVVVNRVEKNMVHGYVSAPKYKPSELAAVGGATITPVAAHSQSSNQPTPSPNQ